ncbi:MAG: hypothetical protein WBV22_07215 [Anaerolineaceae bacterium]
MPNGKEPPVKLLKDTHVLRLAYTASSDYVMFLAFQRIKELQVFRDNKATAPYILKQYTSVMDRISDPVILGAHLYALELTGAKADLRKALVDTLSHKKLRQDTMITQLAGKMAFRLLQRKIPPTKDLNNQELDGIRDALRKEVMP